MGGRPLSNPRASVTASARLARGPWWKSGPAIGLYGALAGVVATLLTTGITTAQAERTFYAEQRSEAYSELLTAGFVVLDDVEGRLYPRDEREFADLVEGRVRVDLRAVRDAERKVQLVSSRAPRLQAAEVVLALEDMERFLRYPTIHPEDAQERYDIAESELLSFSFEAVKELRQPE